jgi:hypothetical protein
MKSPPRVEEREAVWLDLLRRLTSTCSGCAADGNFDEGFVGQGDIDLVAPVNAWPDLEREFRGWAARHQIEPVIVCRHRTGVLMLLAMGTKHTTFFELEARGLRYFRGALLFEAQDLTSMMEMDPRGFRRLRRGAAAMIRLIPSGTRWDGKLKWKGSRIDTIAQWLREDQNGVAESAKLYRAADGSALAAAQGVMEGRWNRKAMLTVGAWALAKSLLRPDILVRRAFSRLFAEKECIVLRTLRENSRQVPHGAREWLETVRADHEVFGDLQPSGQS